ncbi:MAG: type II toxin-antitoxin system RelE/ParE family toxin [Deltaproteobacteria bacterium]|nr:type II toxin-antitoxin system RelE/ParE family toxin [Deltaproteobacteria bacterium]
MKMVWTQEALDKLIEIEAFIATDNPDRAITFIDELIEHTEKTLSDRPLQGRMVPEISHPEIRELLFKKYRLVYRLRQKTIEILTVFEGHRLLRLDEIDHG